ncbi:MAG: hypothetical protein ACRETT_09810, partial [Steroidobacteraceae bacterium]
IGLGLWSSVYATVAVELAFFAAGIWLYVRTTSAADASGRWGLWALVAFLLAVYAASVLGEAPPNVTAIAWVGHAQWILIAWGYWLDRHRSGTKAVE